MIFELFYCFSVWMTEVFLGALLILGFHKIYLSRPVENLVVVLKHQLRLLYFIAPAFLILFFTKPSHLNLVHNLGHDFELKGFAKIYYEDSFLLARFAFDLLIWGGVARFMKKSWMGPVALIVVLITGTQISYDWIMILNPHWKSTGFGLVFLMSSILTSFSLAYFHVRKEPPKEVRNELGKIHFALIGAWTYLNFMQYLVIWSGNLSSESVWYVTRLQTSWNTLSISLIVFQCVLPLFILLVHRFRSSFKVGRSLAFGSFVCQSLFTFLLVEPAFHPEEIRLLETAIVLIVIVVGIRVSSRGLSRA